MSTFVKSIDSFPYWYFLIIVQVAQGSDSVSAETKSVELRFLVGPSEIIPSSSSSDRYIACFFS